MQSVRHDRFRPVAVYVHTTHALLACGSVVAPAVVLSIQPHDLVTLLITMLTAILVAMGSAALVTSEFAPAHAAVGWLRSPASRTGVGVGVLVCALVLAATVPDTGHPVTAASVGLAWALRAVSAGPFWSGIARLLGATVVGGLVLFAVSTASESPWEPLTLVVAALIALGVIGQDAIYSLASELDDLRSREAERAIITERKRFAGDLHDIQGQHLGLITVEAELVSRLIDRGDYDAAALHAERVQAITLEALDEMHRVVHANRDVRLDEEIANAARVLHAAGIATHHDTDGITELNDDTDRLLGLTVREAITNVLTHTRASACSITSRREFRAGRAGVALIVRDSGPRAATVAPPTRPPRKGTGLATLKERYRSVEGELEFTIADGGELVGWLPLTPGTTNGDSR